MCRSVLCEFVSLSRDCQLLCVMSCSIAVTRVATFKELDTDLVRHTGFLSVVRSFSLLPYVTSCRDLGITVTSDLTPSVHVNNIILKAQQRA